MRKTGGGLEIGPKTREQLARFERDWRQGQHGLITGPTGSGKTELASLLADMRYRRNGFVVSFVCKTRPDQTIVDSYLKQGWTRWEKWKKAPRVDERRILLWPKMDGLTLRDAKLVMRDTFAHALDEISRVGLWASFIDEGLFFTSPRELNLGGHIGSMYSLIRSSKGTMVTLAQRPSHLPLTIYANIDWAFVGTASNLGDRKRLSEFGAYDPKMLGAMIQKNTKHDFTWIPVASGNPPEKVNLKD